MRLSGEIEAVQGGEIIQKAMSVGHEARGGCKRQSCHQLFHAGMKEWEGG